MRLNKIAKISFNYVIFTLKKEFLHEHRTAQHFTKPD